MKGKDRTDREGRGRGMIGRKRMSLCRRGVKGVEG